MHADFKQIREFISDEKTLGASANTFDDIQRIFLSGVVDYIGCGPFALTKTKPNDFPILGIKGYAERIKKMEDSGIDLPLIAVGGIKIADTEILLKTGIHGIAISASVNLADDPTAAFKDFYKKIY